jgi:hypothetical protein
MRDRAHRILAGLILFGISFGYVEAAVVVYLRALYQPLRAQLLPDAPRNEPLPLTPLARVASEAPDATRLIPVELVREAATLLMIAGAALIATAAGGRWLPAFACAMGVWDLFFYVFLKVLIGWPTSLLTWDLLFLVPVPWVAPVLAPVLVALSIAIGGVIALLRPVRFRWLHWTWLIVGDLLILFAFMRDFRLVSAGGMPSSFSWPVFGAGLALTAAAFGHACRETGRGQGGAEVLENGAASMREYSQ